jgi:hypothetical protein
MKRVVDFKEPANELEKPKTAEELLLEEIKNLSESVRDLSDQVEKLSNKKNFFVRAKETIEKYFVILFW